MPTRATPPVGYFNTGLAARILICGSACELWATRARDPQAVLERLFASGTQHLVLSSGARLCPRFSAAAATFPGMLWRSARPASFLILSLREQALLDMPANSLHGVMLRVGRLGVLLCGTSGSGKSALALELVARGHALIADDMVMLQRLGPDFLLASGAPEFRGFLAAPPLGVVDVARLYGPRAVARRARVDLLIKCVPNDADKPHDDVQQRLHGSRGEKKVYGVAIHSLNLRARAGCNLAIWVEAACADHEVRLTGYRADEQFLERQRNLTQHPNNTTQASCN